MLQEKLLKANHSCEVCGTKYYACNKCIELSGKGIHGWKLTCCTRDCFQLKMLVDSFESNEIDTTQALQFVNTLTLPVDISLLNEPYKQFLLDLKS